MPISCSTTLQSSSKFSVYLHVYKDGASTRVSAVAIKSSPFLNSVLSCFRDVFRRMPSFVIKFLLKCKWLFPYLPELSLCKNHWLFFVRFFFDFVNRKSQSFLRSSWLAIPYCGNCKASSLLFLDKKIVTKLVKTYDKIFVQHASDFLKFMVIEAREN